MILRKQWCVSKETGLHFILSENCYKKKTKTSFNLSIYKSISVLCLWIPSPDTRLKNKQIKVKILMNIIIKC